MRAATSAGRASVARSASGIASACIFVSISPGSTEKKRTRIELRGERAREVILRGLRDAVRAPAGYALTAASELTNTTRPRCRERPSVRRAPS